MSKQAELREKYPTQKQYDKARAEYKTEQDFSEAIGFSRWALRTHQKWLSSGRKPIVERVKHHYVKNAEIDQGIREIVSREPKKEPREQINPWMRRVVI